MRGLDAERRKNTAGEISERIAAGLSSADLTEDLKWRGAVGEALAGPRLRLLSYCVRIGGRARDRPAGDAAGQRQDMSKGDAAALIAAPLGEGVSGALIPRRYKPVLNGGGAHDAGEALCAAGQLPAARWAA